MTSRLDNAREVITRAITAWLQQEGLEALKDRIEVDVPTEEGHGDLTSSICLRIAKEAKKAPRLLAQDMASSLASNLRDLVTEVEAAGPGFLNFTLSTAWLAQVVNDIRVQGSDYGHSDWGQGQRVLIEFVSANPTGPLVIVSGRAAAVGDSLARIFNANGFRADREFYVNNAGNQILKLGQAIYLRIKELHGEPTLSWPEGVYPGEYVIDVAKQFLQAHPNFTVPEPSDSVYEELGQFGANYLRQVQENVLRHFGVEFDHWTYEKDLRDQKAPEAIVARLESLGFVKEEDGAKWFVSTQFGDDKDRVLVKSDGSYTYFVPDAAYHAQKFERGYDWVIDLLGPDHHGYIGRMRALVQALGFPQDHLEIMIIQLVRLVRDNEVVRMSKRGGQFVTLEDLIEEVGVDPARYFFLERAPNTPMDFDLGLAELKSNENPVYYIQYAAARIHSVLRQWRQSHQEPFTWNPALLSAPLERRLLFVLARFPDVLKRAAIDRAPQYLPKYLTELAGAFHSFYRQHRILEEDPALSMARIALSEATLIVISSGLQYLGISVPESM
ncbi:arginine--tRNA ligase [Sulfobacillus thermosulfidooxidans]|uniref:arginine--tRNA ligase n=1 Tax=Sulfobacillus thermosulfidooxidans TaxID=28034 RepID=UPI00096BA9B6|nr:arginine--tRNA ligase [Sulfobacillus thermosulfidooxidans]OLZ11590.1 arginine--tRNA ligase [Sulfobacillus thermosulfidooxidans]OLZ17432.1 arginine--tRNA ligase [Sulfobacillus thermosulfidooxidans]OLZ21058.1 arginine--tRNA ligase [Sulfobacillus thermosulfidooxidans]